MQLNDAGDWRLLHLARRRRVVFMMMARETVGHDVAISF